MEEWGPLTYKVFPIEGGGDFWAIIDELLNDKSGFINNKKFIVEAYKNNNLYGICLEETDLIYSKHIARNEIFAYNSDTHYMFPCFCVLDENNKETVEIVWTHSRCRGKGLATKILFNLNVKTPYNPLPESSGFWEKYLLLIKN